jgi:hypothetical protein
MRATQPVRGATISAKSAFGPVRFTATYKYKLVEQILHIRP